MKQITLFLLICLVSSSLFADNATTLFNRANKEYYDKDYAKAISDYTSIVNQHYQSPELYFNLGNCYYKTDSVGYAILYYEKAKRLAPSNRDIAFNLQLANVKVSDKIEPINEFILVTCWRSLVRSFTSGTWAIWAIVLLWLGLAGLLLFFFGYTVFLRKLGFFTGLIFTIVAVILFLITFSRYHYDNNERYGVILSPAVHVMSEPDEQSKELFILHEGVKVKIITDADNYKNIQLPDGKEGWIPNNALGVI